jgi:hypothetical protein
MSGHVYKVEFRIWSETLDPGVITSALNLQPCQARRQGSQRADGKTFTGMWAYNGYGHAESPDWDSLEEGLTFVSDKLWPQKEMITGYKSNARLMWWCGHFQSTFDGGPKLSPFLLGKLGMFGADLFIDNYFSVNSTNASRDS